MLAKKIGCLCVVCSYTVLLYAHHYSCNPKSVRCNCSLTVSAVCTAAGSVVMYLTTALQRRFFCALLNCTSVQYSAPLAVFALHSLT
jgi:hypothetical protein